MPIEHRIRIEVDEQDEYGGGGISAKSIRFGGSHSRDGSQRSSDHLAVAASWRKKRLSRLQALANSLAEVQWSSGLLNCLVYEMKIEEDFVAVLADPLLSGHCVGESL